MKKKCPVEGCDLAIQTKDMCGKHKDIVAKGGIIKDNKVIRIGYPPCPSCESKRVRRAGFSPSGKQKYKCNDCDKTWR